MKQTLFEIIISAKAATAFIISLMLYILVSASQVKYESITLSTIKTSGRICDAFLIAQSLDVKMILYTHDHVQTVRSINSTRRSCEPINRFLVISFMRDSFLYYIAESIRGEILFATTPTPIALNELNAVQRNLGECFCNLIPQDRKIASVLSVH
jgi:hypothetical protein